jgi:hypothetical protein
MDLHGLIGKTLGEGVGALDQGALVEVPDTVAVEDGKSEALGNECGLIGVRAAQAHHFEGGPLAELDDASLGLRGAG